MFSVPAELSVFVLVGLILAIIIKSLRDQGAGWAAFAEDNGLTYSRALLRPRLSGTFQGHTVEAEVYQRSHRSSGKRTSKAYTRFKIGLRIPMPAGTLIRHEGMLEAMAQAMGEEEVKLGDPALDSALWIRCKAPDAIREITAEPTLRETLAALRRGTEIWEHAVSVEARGQRLEQLDALLRAGVELAEQVEQARRHPWKEVAAALGLSIDEADSGLVLTGSHRDVSVTVSVLLAEDQVRITAPLSGMPAGLHVSAERAGGGIKLGDPILEGTVSVTGEAPDAIRALLCDDAVREVLLAVVHAWPGSTLTDEAITLIRPGTMVAGLSERLEEVTTLAACIVDGARALD